MKKFDGILICTDLDGTILRNDKSVSKENLEAIEYFKSEGGLFTFITGRMPFSARSIYEVISPNAPIGCINGGGIYDYTEERYLWQYELPKSAIDLVEYADKNIENLGIQINTFDGGFFCRDNSAMVHFRELTNMPNIKAHYREINEPIAKVVFGDEKEETIAFLAELLNNHPRASDYDFIRSERMLYEILPKGSNKGALIAKFAEILGLDMKKTVAVGDYNNDISMIKAAGVGIAVANAKPEVIAVADYVTVSNEEHAIARIIYDIEKNNIVFG